MQEGSLPSKTLPRAEFAQTVDSDCFALKQMGRVMKVVDLYDGAA